MTEHDKTQRVWEQACAQLYCGGCKSGRVLVWAKQIRGALDAPQCAHLAGEHWVAVHCDYFRRRIENSEHLGRCSAFQQREAESADRAKRAAK